MSEVLLTNGQVALVDDEDLHKVAPFTWYALVLKSKRRARIYATRKKPGGGVIYMHRELCDPLPLPQEDVDHRSGDTLDNRKANLRPVSRSDNMLNQPQVRGVRRTKGSSKWEARVMRHGREICRRGFPTEAEAIAARAAILDEIARGLL